MCHDERKKHSMRLPMERKSCCANEKEIATRYSIKGMVVTKKICPVRLCDKSDRY